MWNSDNPSIQRAYIFALYKAGKVKIANQLAQIHLKENLEDERLEKVFSRFSK